MYHLLFTSNIHTLYTPAEFIFCTCASHQLLHMHLTPARPSLSIRHARPLHFSEHIHHTFDARMLPARSLLHPPYKIPTGPTPVTQPRRIRYISGLPVIMSPSICYRGIQSPLNIFEDSVTCLSRAPHTSTLNFFCTHVTRPKAYQVQPRYTHL